MEQEPIIQPVQPNEQPLGDTPSPQTLFQPQPPKKKTPLILVICILVALLAAAGVYMAVKIINKDDGGPDSSQNSSDGDGNTTPQSTYLGIPEFGIKLKQSDNVNDLTYTLLTTRSDGGQSAMITRKSLKDAGICQGSNADTSIVVVTYFEDPNIDTGEESKTFIEMYPDAVEVDGKYYYISPREGLTCYDSKTASQTIVQSATEAHDYLQQKNLLEKL
jgi:hypothetical protein